MSTIDHPEHYNQISGIECIDVIEYFNFNMGNAIKYLWRAGLKTEDPIDDLKKAKWYCEREISRLEKAWKPEDPKITTGEPSFYMYAHTFRVG
jgi:hypothetical protein